MVLVEKDDDIKWFNSSLLAKMKEYNIVLPYLKDLKMLDLNNLQKVESNIATDLNYKGWFDDTIACWDVSHGCQGCNNRQFDYTLCNAGCFGTNTGCTECVNGEDSGISCQGCNSTDEACNTCNTGCEGCDDGCFGSCNSCNVCDSDCFGCNEGCQGTQTCVDQCNTGEGCVSGCQGDYTAGCEKCNDEYDYCLSGWTAACNRSQAEYGCASCNTSCQNTDVCSSYSACTTCVSCDRGNTCITGNQFITSSGCTNNNKDGCFLFFDGACVTGYSHNSVGAITCIKTYGGTMFECSLNFRSNGTDYSCEDGFETTCFGHNKCGSNNTTCSLGYSSDGYCKQMFNDSFVSCQGGYDPLIRAEDGLGHTCERSFSERSFSDGNSSCSLKFTSVAGNKECKLNYTDSRVTCEAVYGNNGSTNCSSVYTHGNLACNTGYSIGSGGQHICIEGFEGDGIECPSNYNNTCSSCNTTSNNVCIDCNNGEAAQCTECVGTGNDANCSSCVAGVEGGCTECVDGNGGCSDCQGCDSGCNADVSCAGYSVGEGNTDVCVGQFTDTTCNQTCIGGYDSSVNCLSEQGCTSCNTGCQGCNAGCQSCDTVQAGCDSCDTCQTCVTGCQGCDTCQTCDGGLGCYSGSFKHECPGEFAACGQSSCIGGCFGAQGVCQQVAEQ